MSTSHLLSINLDYAIIISKNKMTFCHNISLEDYENIMNEIEDNSSLTYEYTYLSNFSILDTIIYMLSIVHAHTK